MVTTSQVEIWAEGLEVTSSHSHGKSNASKVSGLKYFRCILMYVGRVSSTGSTPSPSV